MSIIEKLGLAALHKFDPERAHALSIWALRNGLAPMADVPNYPRLATTVAGIQLTNPLGLAAGYDKNATALGALSKTGFGFLEVGAATPLPQPGNPKPRVFRLTEDQAAINRFGFNNDGMDAIAQRLEAHKKTVPIGLNLGANKTSEDRAGDFARVLERCGNFVDFATVNVSSPNTERLRDLQGAKALSALLDGALEAREGLTSRPSVFLKIAPDLTDTEIDDIAGVALESGVDGIIATNTTLNRDGLQSRFAAEAGGLSGQPLFEASTRVLAKLSKATGGDIPLIGVGGVSNAEQAWAKIQAGASAVQVYTALVYQGLSLIPKTLKGLDERQAASGFETIADAVGSNRDAWL